MLLIVPLLGLIPIFDEFGSPLGRARLHQTVQASYSEELPISNATDNPPNLIVWPEYSFPLDPYERSSAWFLEQMKQVAGDSKNGLLFGAIDSIPDSDEFYNTAYYINPQGELTGKAVKNQPVQFMRDGIAAEHVTVMDVANRTGSLRMGIGICYDGSYQQFARKMVVQKADFLVSPTMNTREWGAIQHRQHQRMFQMRAIETRRGVLVAANSGPTFATTAYSSVEAELPCMVEDTLDVWIWEPEGMSVFVRFGWLIGPLCLAAVCCVFAVALWKAALSKTASLRKGREK